jgi:hypothetical protein
MIDNHARGRFPRADSPRATARRRRLNLIQISQKT